MHILLIGFGSRGDVQPLLALGQGLQQAGYDVSIAAASNFKSLVEDAGLGYAYIGADMQTLMSSDDGKHWVENSKGNYFKQAQVMRRIINQAGEDVVNDLMTATSEADVLVSGLSSFGLIDAIATHQNKPHLTILLAPMHPTRTHAATMQPIVPRSNIFLNRLSGTIGQYFTHWIFKEATNQLRENLGQAPLKFKQFSTAYNRRVPTLYGLSPQMMPRADDWAEHIHVTGYWFHDVADDWQASQALLDFLDAGPAPVYIGFGSMSSSDPAATTRLMIDALQQTGQRGIIHSGWAELNERDLPDSVFLLDYAPHEWLFPKMAAVIHHGGAGTTAVALRAGVPNSVIAHMADQPYWGRRVHELGVGLPVIQRHQLTTDQLATLLRQLTTDPSLREKATQIGHTIQQEDGVTQAVTVFNHHLKGEKIS